MWFLRKLTAAEKKYEKLLQSKLKPGRRSPHHYNAMSEESGGQMELFRF